MKATQKQIDEVEAELSEMLWSTVGYVEQEWFTDFLRFLVEQVDYQALEIVGVVESPWKWKKEFKEYFLWKALGEPDFSDITVPCPDCGGDYELEDGRCYGDECFYKGGPFG